MLRPAATALTLALVPPAFARACPKAQPLAVPAETTHALENWIETHSEYSPGTLGAPKVFLCRTGEVISYEGHDMIVDPSLRAAYDLVNDRIFLVAPWSATNLRQVSSLLHELVHRAQFRTRRWTCPNAAEPEAYRLQQEWLAEHGVEARFNWFAIRLRARCFTGRHP